MQLYNNKQIEWHESQWKEILGGGMARVPHALLLNGIPGLGKRIFADQLAALLLCETPDVTVACGNCSGCRWLGANSHPDFRSVSPDGEESDNLGGSTGEAVATAEADAGNVGRKVKKRGSSHIGIDAIRDLEDFVFIGSHRQGRRVVMITDAAAMNASAANALLKILEEPPASVYFILITENTKRLLPTLRSRCRSINFIRPTSPQAARWLLEAGLPKGVEKHLPLAGGAPMQLLHWQESGQLAGLEALLESFRQSGSDPLALAGMWDSLLKRDDKLKLEFLVEAVQRWLFDYSLLTVVGQSHFGVSAAPTASSAGKSMHSTANPHALSAGWRELLRFRRSARHPLNQLLFLEDLATHCLRALGKLNVTRGAV